MPRPISAADDTPVRVVIVTLDGHLSGATDRAAATLRGEMPGLRLSLHSAAEWRSDPESLEACKRDIAQGDIIIATMLFMEAHIQAVLPDLTARREDCDAMLGLMSAAEVMRLTRVGGFRMDRNRRGPLSLLQKLRGNRKKDKQGSAGAQQLAMLRRIPQILRFIPGTAQDVRAYFMAMQYWLAGSEENVANLVRFMVDRYAAGPRRGLRGRLKPDAPVQYPEVGLYHPALKHRITDDAATLPVSRDPRHGRVGVLVMRSYVLAGNSAHYDAVLAALEAQGLETIPAFAGGLDAREAVERYFLEDGRSRVDAVVSLTGFSLVGGPAYNDSRAAAAMLAQLDVPYLAAHATEFQSLEQWQDSDQGLLPVEATMMVAIPELDGATGPVLFGGRSATADTAEARDMQPHAERAEVLARRVGRLIGLRRCARDRRRLGIVLFNFPPNAGATGTAAHLAVWESLHATLERLREEGYSVEVPASSDALRRAVLEGNAGRYGSEANVHQRIAVDDYVRQQPWLEEIESQWGPAPGRHNTDGSALFVLGAQFGNVFVGVQPGFGYEGDPMRLLFEQGFSPTHAFAAFYHYLKQDFGAHAVLHFGTHGALEFMPGKQSGMSADCWPDRLIGDLPNFYLYAANNPAEGTIAKRRAAATLISYLTPTVTEAGLYRDLDALKSTITRWRATPPAAIEERQALAVVIQSQAAELDLASAEPEWPAAELDTLISHLHEELQTLEKTLIPHGMHVVGKAPAATERRDLLLAMDRSGGEPGLAPAVIDALVDGATVEQALAAAGSAQPEDETAEALATRCATLERVNRMLSGDHELDGIVSALDGRFVPPVAGGDLLRAPDILPTGRNVHGFDPFRIPSAFALTEGERQAELLLQRHHEDHGGYPESVAIVLWGTDNLKSEGGPIAQALALMGAAPRFDSYGRLCGASLKPLEQLDRPRIDVVMTLSGIFRDLLPHQTRVLAEAALLAASADEPVERNFVRQHALAYQQASGCDMATAALRVFSNAQGAYGANVNYLIDNSRWDDGDELAETFSRRKCFAYGADGAPQHRQDQLQRVLGDVQLAYQNLESVELGVTTIDHYFDTLGGISRAVQRASGHSVPVYIGDQTGARERVRTLSEQVDLETRTRMLNPKWYESMLDHGYEGVRQIEAHITNTMGWSATTGQVAPWVYRQLTQTFMLDDAMRERLANLNPIASARVANRLLEAHERHYWSPDEATLDALRRAGEDLEDRLEGIDEVAVA